MNRFYPVFFLSLSSAHVQRTASFICISVLLNAHATFYVLLSLSQRQYRSKCFQVFANLIHTGIKRQSMLDRRNGRVLFQVDLFEKSAFFYAIRLRSFHWLLLNPQYFVACPHFLGSLYEHRTMNSNYV